MTATPRARFAGKVAGCDLLPASVQNLLAADAAFTQHEAERILVSALDAATATKLVKRGADSASIAARSCSDPAWLDRLAVKERRVSVLEALAGNPHLPPSAAIVIAEWATGATLRWQALNSVFDALPYDVAYEVGQRCGHERGAALFVTGVALGTKLVAAGDRAAQLVEDVLTQSPSTTVTDGARAEIYAAALRGELSYLPADLAVALLERDDDRMRFETSMRILINGTITVAAARVIAGTKVTRYFPLTTATASMTAGDRTELMLETTRIRFTEPDAAAIMAGATAMEFRRIVAAQADLPVELLDLLVESDPVAAFSVALHPTVERARAVMPVAAILAANHRGSRREYSMEYSNRLVRLATLDELTLAERVVLLGGDAITTLTYLLDPVNPVTDGDVQVMYAALDDTQRVRFGRLVADDWSYGKLHERSFARELLEVLEQPISLVLGGCSDVFKESVVGYLVEHLGEDPMQWELVATLGPEFVGTLPQLVGTVQALS